MPFIDGCTSRDTYLMDENNNKKREEKSGGCMSSFGIFFREDCRSETVKTEQ